MQTDNSQSYKQALRPKREQSTHCLSPPSLPHKLMEAEEANIKVSKQQTKPKLSSNGEQSLYEVSTLEVDSQHEFLANNEPVLNSNAGWLLKIFKINQTELSQLRCTKY